MSRFIERRMAAITTVAIIIACLVQVCVCPGNAYPDDIEIRSITENPLGSLHKVRSVVGTVDRIIYERGNEGGSCYELRDDYGGRIQVVSVDDLPENFVGKKVRVKGKVEQNNETSDSTDVCIFENERQIFGSGVLPPPQIPWGLIIIAASGIVSVIAGITVFIIVYVQKGFRQAVYQNDQLREEILKQQQQKKQDEAREAEDKTVKLLASHLTLERNGMPLNDVKLYKGPANVTPEGGCSFTIRREPEEDEALKKHERIAFITLPGQAVSRKCHAKLLVDEYEKRFELQQVSPEGTTLVHQNGRDTFSLQKNQKVELRNNDRIEIGGNMLVFRKVEAKEISLSTP